MPKRLVLLIDGGYVRAQAKRASPPQLFAAPLVAKLANACVDAATEELLRVLCYDCPEFSGSRPMPVSGLSHTFHGSDKVLNDLEALDLFAVRRGTLAFRGWEPKPGRAASSGAAVTDADFAPRFEQKGIDMRIGLDIATYTTSGRIDRVGIVTADTDFVPALKHARRAGLQVTIYELPGQRLHSELVAHSDFRRVLAW